MTDLVERSPHLATRAVVDTLGREAPRTLYRAFDDFNAAHFAGRLGPPLILITPPASARALGDYSERDVHGLRSTIRIAPSSFRRGERYALDVLLHEMIHAHMSEVDGDTESGYRGHGPKFTSKCNEIGRALGLPEVGVKGRKGLPNSAQWPLCVRPDGYYPPLPPKKQRTAANDDTGGAAPESEDDEDGAGNVTPDALRRAFEAGEKAGEARAKRDCARQVRRRVRRLRRAYGETHPELAALVATEAEIIADAIESSEPRFDRMPYPKASSRPGVRS